MQVATLTRAAFGRIPSTLKGPVTFTRADASASTTGMALGVPGRGAGSDTFQDRAAIRQRNRVLVVDPTGLDFAPAAGMTASWETVTWNVLSVGPLDPAGTGTAALYRVVLQR